MSKGNINTYLRSDENWAAYKAEPKRHADECFLCDMETIECFTHWYICKNQFPYDNVATFHDMLVPINHITNEHDLSGPARRELELILQRLNDECHYDCIVRNFTIGQSQPQHLHYHLITWKRR